MEKSSTQNKEVYLVTNVVNETQLRKAQKRALNFFANSVECTYGPMGGYTAYSYGNLEQSTKAIHSNYTKDGFTVLKHLDTDKPIESLLKEEIRDICARVIKVVGDGTTSAVMMSSYIFDGLTSLQNIGYNKRDIINYFAEAINNISKNIKDVGRKATLEDIYNIALTSLNGQEEYAKIIKKIYEDNGMNVFIDVAVSNNVDTITKIYAGMTYDTGYVSPCFINNQTKKSCELYNPEVYVFESPIDTPEMINILQMIVEQNIQKPAFELREAQAKKKSIKNNIVSTIVIAPQISRDANSYLDSLISAFSNAPIENRLPLCIVSGISNYNQYLLDIMSLTGAKFIKKYIDPETYEKDKKEGLAPTPSTLRSFAGKAEQVVVNALSTRIVNPKNMYEDGKVGEYSTFFKNYIDQLKDLLHKYEETKEELVKIGNLKRRINILEGNMVDLLVGGIGISDRDSLRDSIEDAVLNCRSAARVGVGNGANFEGLIACRFCIKDLNSSTSDEDKVNIDPSKHYKGTQDERKYIWNLKYAIYDIIKKSYEKLISKIYLPYCDYDLEKCEQIMNEGLSQDINYIGNNIHMALHKGPFNIVTQKYDRKVLTSIDTEPTMLEAINKIITLMFNTNQFLLPNARFNIYEMTDSLNTPED